VFVTHDQEEALALSDKIVVMNHGCIEQIGSPQEIYKLPATRFVAEFVGQSNIFPGKIGISERGRRYVRIADGFRVDLPAYADLREGQPVEVVVRAQSIDIAKPHAAGEANDRAGIRGTGKIISVAFLGSLTSYLVETSGILVKVVSSERVAPLSEGDSVVLTVSPDELVLFDGIKHSLLRASGGRRDVG
jgi:ABC-type Fe3+/spermidine/putrescine transport system ATPase subunit